MLHIKEGSEVNCDKLLAHKSDVMATFQVHTLPNESALPVLGQEHI